MGRAENSIQSILYPSIPPLTPIYLTTGLTGREDDKVARQCAVERVDYARYLLRMTELELLDRERRST